VIETHRRGPRIFARARSRPGGAILLVVAVPGAGGVKAVARGRAGRPRKLRALATGSARAKGEKRSKVRIVLRPVRRYRNELRARGRIRARIRIAYVAARGGRRLAATLPAAFRLRRVAAARGKRRGKRARRAFRRARR
jgi:hypothetical protein